MIKFDKDKVLLLQQLVIESSGGSTGIRDMRLLDSALENAYQTFDGKDLYYTKQEKAAIIGYSLISNHAFVDGNKRIGALVMLSFLKLNGVALKYTDNELIDLCLSTASGKSKYQDVLNWILSHESYA